MNTIKDLTAYSWTAEDIKEIKGNFKDELSTGWMYKALAEIDNKNERAGFLRNLAKYEEKHTEIWSSLLKHLNHDSPSYRPTLEHRIFVQLAHLFGVGAILPLVHKGEIDGIAKYKKQSQVWNDPVAQKALNDVLPEEISHEVDIFHTMRKIGTMRETLRSAILGVNDGLGSVLALVAGVAGATGSSQLVLMSGIAGLVAGAVSMGASNYVSVKSEQDVNESLTRLQRDALAFAPETKKKQLVDAYERKGFTKEEAESIVRRLSHDPAELLKAILAEEHGVDNEERESSLRLAAYTAIAFAFAGLIPVLPFFVMPALSGMITSVILTSVALFAAGVIRALTTLNSVIKSGIEMVLVGLGSAVVTYIIGALVGITV